MDDAYVSGVSRIVELIKGVDLLVFKDALDGLADIDMTTEQ
jgi:hypothetical protein